MYVSQSCASVQLRIAIPLRQPSSDCDRGVTICMLCYTVDPKRLLLLGPRGMGVRSPSLLVGTYVSNLFLANRFRTVMLLTWLSRIAL